MIYRRYIFRGRIIAGLGLGLDYSWSRSRTQGLERRPVLVSKKVSGLDLEAVVSTTTLINRREFPSVFI